MTNVGMLCHILLSVHLLICLQPVISIVTIQLTIHNFSDPSNRHFDGECCKPSWSCAANCSLVFVVNFNSSCSNARCSLQMLSNARETPFNVLHKLQYWNDTLEVMISVYDVNWGASALVDFFQLHFNASLHDRVTLLLIGHRMRFVTILYAAVEVDCDENYYGPQCSNYCRPRDNCFGHYTCNVTTGSKMCLDGWTGDQCSEALTHMCPSLEQYQPLLNGFTCHAIDIVFVLHSSAAAARFQMLAKSVIAGVIDSVPISASQYQVSVVTFADAAFLSIKLKDFYNKTELIKNVMSLPLQGSKLNLRKGLSIARTKALSVNSGMRPFAYKAIVVMWNGNSPSEEFGTLADEASRLRNLKDVISVFVVNDVANTLAGQIASDFGYILTADYSDSDFLIGTISAAIQLDCSRIAAAVPLTGTGTSQMSQPESTVAPLTGTSPLSQTSAFSNSVTDNYCSGHGICNAVNGSSSTCCCEPAYAGDHCEYFADPCSTQPCNLGQCVVLLASYYCVCPPGISGVNCELTGGGVSSCPTPSSDNSSCPTFLMSNSCAEFYFGPPDCNAFCRPSDSCINGHFTCTNNGIRQCLPGWTGINCTTNTLGNNSDCYCQDGATWWNGRCFPLVDSSTTVETPSTSAVNTTANLSIESTVSAIGKITTAHAGSITSSVLYTTTFAPTTGTIAPEKSIIEQFIEFIQTKFPDLTPDDQLQLLAILLQKLSSHPTATRFARAVQQPQHPIYLSRKWNGSGSLSGSSVQLEIWHADIVLDSAGSALISMIYDFIVNSDN